MSWSDAKVLVWLWRDADDAADEQQPLEFTSDDMHCGYALPTDCTFTLENFFGFLAFAVLPPTCPPSNQQRSITANNNSNIQDIDGINPDWLTVIAAAQDYFVNDLGGDCERLLDSAHGKALRHALTALCVAARRQETLFSFEFDRSSGRFLLRLCDSRLVFVPPPEEQRRQQQSYCVAIDTQLAESKARYFIDTYVPAMLRGTITCASELDSIRNALDRSLLRAPLTTSRHKCLPFLLAAPHTDSIVCSRSLLGAWVGAVGDGGAPPASLFSAMCAKPAVQLSEKQCASARDFIRQRIAYILGGGGGGDLVASAVDMSPAKTAGVKRCDMDTLASWWHWVLSRGYTVRILVSLNDALYVQPPAAGAGAGAAETGAAMSGSVASTTAGVVASTTAGGVASTTAGGVASGIAWTTGWLRDVPTEMLRADYQAYLDRGGRGRVPKDFLEQLRLLCLPVDDVVGAHDGDADQDADDRDDEENGGNAVESSTRKKKATVLQRILIPTDRNKPLSGSAYYEMSVAVPPAMPVHVVRKQLRTIRVPTLQECRTYFANEYGVTLE
jgi:hypothetical protein